MDPRPRTALRATAAVLAVLLLGYGFWSFVGWRRAQLRQAAPTVAPDVAPPPAATSTPTPAALLLPQPAAHRDTDLDGLPDNLETIYRTDPANKDTDGDGHLDGSEVANGYDPTIPSPNDKITLPTPAPAGPTFTDQYFDRVGLPPSRENLFKAGSAELDEFIARVNARGFLPDVPDADITVVSAAGKRAVETYLDAVSSKHNTRLTPVDAGAIDRAFRALTETKNAQPLEDLLAAINRNADELRRAPVPREAVSLHTQYLAATLALRQNIELLKNYQSDFVGVLVAASRIDTIAGVFQSVEEGIRTLEKKYGIT